MDIKKIETLSNEDWLQLGSFGYKSTQKYDLTKEESQGSCSMHLTLINLDDIYEKEELNSTEDLERYEEIIIMGFSYGIFIDGKIIALAISEPQHWNNTLMIWHLQVNETYIRKGYGRLLINKVNEIAQEQGFRAITLETQNTNVPAIHFYMQCGYQIEGIDVSLYSNNPSKNEEIALYMRKKIK
ncbi:GNAT family N-acetyltransferase [Paenibacillus sp. F6_3S_P_1C]|uniref:GNAT family N-acetyltransferase n=1 Tax=Paenibacillus vandeheii TaxID=3035917 RepID=A0ABT8JDR0_9BACL|nr:GNAT family N-acetyltransferase [Paenibacillus vandeheii]MDN4603235.1 GNAT family N-acetyltransferase [Paenibacillus vandeheii]